MGAGEYDLAYQKKKKKEKRKRMYGIVEN